MGTPSITTQPSRHRNPLRIALALLSLLITLHSHAQTTIINATLPLILPSAVAFDPQGNLYIAETGNHVIRKIDTLGQITTIAGSGTQGFSGDNGPASAAQLDSPQGLALSNTILYIADTHNHSIRKLDLTTNLITTIAGTTTPGFDGDSGPATSAHLSLPTAITLDTNQNLYVADTANHRIRRIDATTNIITTIAGTGTQGFSGDGALATAASIDSPTGLASDTANNLFLADTHNHRIRKIDAITGIITTIAGTGTLGQSGDNAAATTAQLALPHGLTIDPLGNLYLADTANHRIRRIDAATGIITTIAGTGTQGYSGDNGPATSANLDSPRSATLSPTQLTIADTNNQRVRQLTSSQIINTIAGLGNTTPGTLTLIAPSVIAYGTGQLTATLASATAATGSITFLDTYASTTTTLATTPLTTNTATFITTTLPAGTHTITATYPGDLTHTSAQSTAYTLTITPAPTQTSFTLPASPAILPASITAQVASTTTGIPTGTLTLLDVTNPAANTPIATATLTSSGAATFIVSTLASGNHNLTAAYAGDPNFQPSTTTPAILTITTPITTPADFALTATSPASQTIPSGTSATFTFTAPTQGNLSSPITPQRRRPPPRSHRYLQPHPPPTRHHLSQLHLNHHHPETSRHPHKQTSPNPRHPPAPALLPDIEPPHTPPPHTLFNRPDVPDHPNHRRLRSPRKHRQLPGHLPTPNLQHHHHGHRHHPHRLPTCPLHNHHPDPPITSSYSTIGAQRRTSVVGQFRANDRSFPKPGFTGTGITIRLDDEDGMLPQTEPNVNMLAKPSNLCRSAPSPISKLLKAFGLMACVVSFVASAFGQGKCRDGYSTPICPLTAEVATAPIQPAFAPTGWTTVALDHITFRVADYRKEAAFYVALMGWRSETMMGSRPSWTSALGFGHLQTGAQPAMTAVVITCALIIEPWNAATGAGRTP